MSIDITLFTAGLWVVFAILAILNGVLREKLITPFTGKSIGDAISSIILALLIFLVTNFFLPMISANSNQTLWLIGLTWVILTMAFEFLFGHYVMKHSWEALLANYNIFKGKLWILVLIAELAAPVASKYF